MAGGLYDQHPRFIDQMWICMEEEAKAEKRKQARRDAERGRGGKPGASTMGRRRR